MIATGASTDGRAWIRNLPADIKEGTSCATSAGALRERGSHYLPQLLERFGTAEEALAGCPSWRGAGTTPSASSLQCRQGGSRAGTPGSTWGRPSRIQRAAYPEALAAIPDAPPTLSYKGNLALLRRPSIAVVGARNASAVGRSFAKRLAHDLSAAGFLVVSGLARGIDTAAHQGALERGTIAILAGGIDYIYPPENRDLHLAIAEQGLLLAELPPGLEPQARHFPRRNRIISGISLGVSRWKGAPLRLTHHARLATEQGREVLRYRTARSTCSGMQ